MVDVSMTSRQKANASMIVDDTIAAIATPLGESGLAVIRISGAEALAVADRCFTAGSREGTRPSAAATHTLHYGHIVHAGQTVDEVLLSVMRAPRTFTREDVVEISCHGGILPAKLVLETVLANGARLAQPGEFTRRAFLNGRIDLPQAEAVADLIRSRTELALRAANEQLAGRLSRKVEELRQQLMETLAHVEAHIDFPEEDIAPDTRENLLKRLEGGVRFMDELLRTANDGRILRRGIRAVIIGEPNAGKSSLLNRLLGHDRAIVSAIPGTTRDTIEETANIGGLPVVFIDTAGLREGRDEIELEGIRRSHRALDDAELILHVLDSSKKLSDEDRDRLDQLRGRKRIVVRNKIDLPVRSDMPGTTAPVVEVSCLTGQGLDSLKAAITGLAWSGEIKVEMLQVMINSRHQDALNRARAAVLRTVEALREERTLEVVALDLRVAANTVGEIVGQTATEDLLDMIFSQFCIGK